MNVLVYFFFLLLIRLFFNFGEKAKHLFWYALKAAIEAGFLTVVYSMPISLSLACVGLVLLLNLLFYILDAKLFVVKATGNLRSICHLVSFVLYALSFLFVFYSGKQISLAPYMVPWIPDEQILIVGICALLVTSELAHFVGYVFRKLSGEEPIPPIKSAGQRAIGVSERLVVFILCMALQFVAVSIVFVGRAIFLAMGKSGQGEKPTAFVSLSLALLFSIILRFAVL